MSSKVYSGQLTTTFYVIEAITILMMPVIIKSTTRKKKQILDPLINSSYSSISILILNMIQLTAYFELVSGGALLLYLIVGWAGASKEIVSSFKQVWEWFQFIPFNLNWFLVLTQIYEYSNMIHAIVVQKGQTMSEAIKMFENLVYRAKYIRGEKSIGYIYVFTLVLLVCVNLVMRLIMQNVFGATAMSWNQANSAFLRDLIVLFALLMSGSLVLFFLKVRYNNEYHMQKCHLIMFISTEILVNVLFLIRNFYKDEHLVDTLLYYLVHTGLRTCLQAFGFLILKKSRDPMESIQALEYMHLISKVQKTTPNFIPSLKRQTTWSELTDVEKDQFGKAYLEKMEHAEAALKELQDLMGNDCWAMSTEDDDEKPSTENQNLI